MDNLKNLSNEELIKLLLESEAKTEKLQAENERLNDVEKELNELKSSNDSLTNENSILKNKNQSLEAEVASSKNKIAELEVQLRNTNLELEKKIKQYENSKVSNKNRARKDYFSSSEKDKVILNDFESNLSAKEEKELRAELENVDKAINKPGRKSGGYNLNNNICPSDLEVVTKDFTDEELMELEKKGRLKRIGEDVCVKLIKEESKVVYRWVKIIRPKYRNTVTNEIVQKESTDAFKKCMVDSSVIADLINHKMNLGVPVERMSQYFKSMNIDLSSSLLSRYMMASANILTPIYEAMVKTLVNNNNQVIHCDETPLKVLENQKERVWSYMFVLATSFWDKPIYIYDFNMTRKTDRIEQYLKDYHGYLTVDAYSGYEKFKNDDNVKPTVEEIEDKAKFNLKGLQKCWTHARRMFIQVDSNMLSKNKSKLKSETLAAYKVVTLMRELFKKEAKFKEKNLTKEQIQAKRNTKEYNNILNRIKTYVDSLNPAKETKLAKACGYLKNHWNDLITMQEYGGLDINNSLALSPRIYYPQLLEFSAN